jgi:hypothetical protein
VKKDARYLIRLYQAGSHRPEHQTSLLQSVRELVNPLGGKAINLRVSPSALEFDLFIAPDEEVAKFSSVLKQMSKVITCKRLDVPPPPVDPAALVAEGRRLFNEQRFWEVHEVLEGLWKDLHKGAEKELVQGLILTAAALVHVQKDEWTPVWTMLADAMKRLAGQPDTYYGWDIARFRDHFMRVLAQKKIEIPTV